MPAQRSIVIGGGAFAGLALALALRQGLGADIPIIVADPALGLRPSRDPRATAIVAACRRLFEALGVWDQVAAQAQPILDMVVTDSRLQDATRPVFLTFAGDVEPGEPFAHMVENRHLIDALVKRAEAEGVDLRATSVTTFDSRSDGVDVTLADGGVVEASLLVAADGARSKLRERAGIVTYGWDYDQSGIVVTVGHERDHGGRAEEHFLPAGPFAILPLMGKRSSLVWTEKRDEAARIVALAEVIVDAARLGIDLGQADVLERYQRWRRFDTMAMGLATNSLNLLFSNESTLLRAVRDIGLGLVDRAPPLKNLFIRQAAGLAGEVPRLLKGEAL